MDKGFYCIFCGAELIHSSSEMCHDRGDYADDDTAIINYFDCPKCGRNYEIWDPSKEERETEFKDYWE